MKYLMILTVGVCLLFASVPVMADQTDNVKVKFIARAKMYEDSRREIVPKNDGDVVIVMRIEGTTIENVHSKQKPTYVEFNGVKVEATSAGLTRTKSLETGEINSFIELVFCVPEKITEMKLVIDKCAPVTISAPTKVL